MNRVERLRLQSDELAGMRLLAAILYAIGLAVVIVIGHVNQDTNDARVGGARET